ncbi:MAG: SHOCT domain-containing protein [Candidatus Helarchaeota archaeon]
MPEDQHVLFAAEKHGRYTKKFRHLFEMDSAKIKIIDRDIVISPKKKKLNEIIINVSKIVHIYGHKPKIIPYYELVLENGEKIYISFYTGWGSNVKKLHQQFIDVLYQKLGIPIESEQMQYLNHEKIIFKCEKDCFYSIEVSSGKYEHKEVILKVYEDYLKIWDRKTNEVILNIPLLDIKLFFENIIIKSGPKSIIKGLFTGADSIYQADKINHKIILKNGKIFYITFRSALELREELQANFGKTMTSLLKKLRILPQDQYDTGKIMEDPLTILKKRLARGELTLEEYNMLRRAIEN